MFRRIYISVLIFAVSVVSCGDKHNSGEINGILEIPVASSGREMDSFNGYSRNVDDYWSAIIDQNDNGLSSMSYVSDVYQELLRDTIFFSALPYDETGDVFAVLEPLDHGIFSDLLDYVEGINWPLITPFLGVVCLCFLLILLALVLMFGIVKVNVSFARWISGLFFKEQPHKVEENTGFSEMRPDFVFDYPSLVPDKERWDDVVIGGHTFSFKVFPYVLHGVRIVVDRDLWRVVLQDGSDGIVFMSSYPMCSDEVKDWHRFLSGEVDGSYILLSCYDKCPDGLLIVDNDGISFTCDGVSYSVFYCVSRFSLLFSPIYREVLKGFKQMLDIPEEVPESNEGEPLNEEGDEYQFIPPSSDFLDEIDSASFADYPDVPLVDFYTVVGEDQDYFAKAHSIVERIESAVDSSVVIDNDK